MISTCTRIQLSTATPISPFVQPFVFILTTAFDARQIYRYQNSVKAIICVYWNELVIPMVFTTEGFLKVAIESSPEC